MSEYKKVTIYTDGACIRNPGPGGYGVVLIHADDRQELAGGFQMTTNNRMEIIAAIAGLQSLKTPCTVTIFSDSKYLVDGIAKGWAKRWKANGWMRNPKERAVNIDLWDKLLGLCSLHEVNFQWVQGHAGIKENVRCDKLSTEAAKRENLPTDHNYESGEASKSAPPTLFD